MLFAVVCWLSFKNRANRAMGISGAAWCLSRSCSGIKESAWEGQDRALCLGEKQGLCMNSGMTKIQSEVTNASVHTQKKSMHCTFVSCTELVTQLQPPGPACSNTEIVQFHLQHTPSHLVHLFPFPSPILPCLHISVSQEITKGERPFFSASCWPPFSSPQALKLIKWCHAWF